MHEKISLSRNPRAGKNRNALVNSYIYVVEGGGFLKVGSALDPKKRLAGLQGANPHPLRIIHCSRLSQPWRASLAEREAHLALRPHRARGGREWFQCQPDIAVAAVKAAAKAAQDIF